MNLGTIGTGVLAVFFCVVGVANANLIITVDEATDSFGAIGDYRSVEGNNVASSPGQVEEVLGGPGGGGLSGSGGTSSGSNSVNMSDLFDVLDNAGITSTNILVFGFATNESGGNNSPVSITQLDMTFQRPSAADFTVSLDAGMDNTIVVDDFQSGISNAEAKIEVEVPFDFMAEYSTTSTEQFTISATLVDESGGFELFFLDAGFTIEAIPEPSAFLTMALVSLIVVSGKGMRQARRE